MKKLLKLLFVLILLSCKGESKKVNNENISKRTTDSIQHNSLTQNDIPENCYDYLTELVRSSDFPFFNWKVKKEQVNLLIDEHTDEYIRAKLFFQTEGTGTIGWIEFYYKTGELLNTSANLEEPVKLTYNEKWKRSFDSCIHSKSENVDISSLKEIYQESSEIKLPISYNFDEIMEEKNFITINEKYYHLFSIEHQSNYKIAKLPAINDFKPVILITYNDAGQSTWRLFILDNDYKPISNLILYTSIELNNGSSKSKTYNITKDYSITINEMINDKTIHKKNYIISKEGKIIEK